MASYASALAKAIVGLGDELNFHLTWACIIIRVVHVLFQATINKVMISFALFLLSDICLFIIKGNAMARLANWPLSASVCLIPKLLKRVLATSPNSTGHDQRPCLLRKRKGSKARHCLNTSGKVRTPCTITWQAICPDQAIA
jgi:hypothetical protein